MRIKKLVKEIEKMISEGKKPMILFPRQMGKSTLFEELKKKDATGNSTRNNQR